MSRTEIVLRTPIERTFRVEQAAGMFDLAIEEKSEQKISVESPPAISEDWRIGLIVGPSGSGKSTTANHFYPGEIYRGGDWPEARSVLDGFGDLGIRAITQALTMVGFSSPPSWLKQFSVLSNGEKFRCELARALLCSPSNPVVFDEFTSVVDRTVAKVCSAAVSRAVKKGTIDKKFIAVTCHYDVAQWLEPDWILDLATGCVARRSLRRPPLELRIMSARRSLWSLFGKHHYLSANLSPAAQCYAALWEGRPVAFCALLPLFGFKNRRRVSRIVVLPDYQGIGIGSSFLNAMGRICRGQGLGLNITTGHPAMMSYCSRSDQWRTVCFRKIGRSSMQFGKKYKGTAGRATASFEYWGSENFD